MADFSDTTLNKRNDLHEGIKNILKAIPVDVMADKDTVIVNFQGNLICGVQVLEEAYKIYNVSEEWEKKTSYLCNKAEDGTYYCFLDTIDECIGEVRRLVLFEAQKGNKKFGLLKSHDSELSKVMTKEAFEKAFSQFIKQADENAISGKSKGGKSPAGFPVIPHCDGANITVHYGQGNATKTPYMCWHVVSIYYLPDNGNITMGIEETRYVHLNKMQIKPLRYEYIGNKKDQIAVFYSTAKSSINYADLYENFLNVCEEVIHWGLT